MIQSVSSHDISFAYLKLVINRTDLPGPLEFEITRGDCILTEAQRALTIVALAIT